MLAGLRVLLLATLLIPTFLLSGSSEPMAVGIVRSASPTSVVVTCGVLNSSAMTVTGSVLDAGFPILCYAMVAGNSPSGSVSWNIQSPSTTTGLGSCGTSLFDASHAGCGINPILPDCQGCLGGVNITASYGGDQANQAANGSEPFTINPAINVTLTPAITWKDFTQTYSWTATVSGGTPPYTNYLWYVTSCGFDTSPLAKGRDASRFESEVPQIWQAGTVYAVVRDSSLQMKADPRLPQGYAANLKVVGGCGTAVFAGIDFHAGCAQSFATVGVPIRCSASVLCACEIQDGRTVTWSSSGGGKFSSPSCNLGSNLACSVSFTPSKADPANPQIIHAVFPGGGGWRKPPDGEPEIDNGNFSLTVTNLPTPRVVSGSCLRSRILVGASTTCKLRLAGSPTGNVTWSVVDGDGLEFTPSTCLLVLSQCSVSIKGDISGQETISAVYNGDLANNPVEKLIKIKILPNPTRTSVSCSALIFRVSQTTHCTVTVTGVAPSGNVTVTYFSGSGRASPVPSGCNLASSTCGFDLTGTQVGLLTVRVSYLGDNVNGPSSRIVTLRITA